MLYVKQQSPASTIGIGMMADVEEMSTVFKGTIVNGESPNNVEHDPFISNEVCHMLELIFYVGINGSISAFGSAANIINIIIFVKQGFSDSVNISLCGLAVSDLLSLLALLWKAICMNPLFQYSDIDFDPVQIQYVTAANWMNIIIFINREIPTLLLVTMDTLLPGYHVILLILPTGLPRGGIVRITSWITAFITFERCVCIALPLKVKEIITPRRTLLYVIVVYISMFATITPTFFSVHFVPVFQPERNKSIIGIEYDSNYEKVQNISFSMHVLLQFSCLFIMVACTLILIYKLLVTSEWRRKALMNPLEKTDSTRDKRILKMVTLMSSIFIICLVPNCFVLILMLHSPLEFNVIGRYQNSFQVSWAIVNTLESANCSINIFVYYNMSSKFRRSFNRLFRLVSVRRNTIQNELLIVRTETGG